VVVVVVVLVLLLLLLVVVLLRLLILVACAIRASTARARRSPLCANRLLCATRLLRSIKRQPPRLRPRALGGACIPKATSAMPRRRRARQPRARQ
jgi:hypothetical protein